MYLSGFTSLWECRIPFVQSRRFVFIINQSHCSIFITRQWTASVQLVSHWSFIIIMSQSRCACELVNQSCGVLRSVRGLTNSFRPISDLRARVDQWESRLTFTMMWLVQDLWRPRIWMLTDNDGIQSSTVRPFKIANQMLPIVFILANQTLPNSLFRPIKCTLDARQHQTWRLSGWIDV